MSPALRWWSPWWWPLVHLRSFRCRLLDGSHYTCTLHRVQIKTTQTSLKPLETLAPLGVSKPRQHDKNDKPHIVLGCLTTHHVVRQRVTATATHAPRPRLTAWPRDGHTRPHAATSRPRHSHTDRTGHATATRLYIYPRIGTMPPPTTGHADIGTHTPHREGTHGKAPGPLRL